MATTTTAITAEQLLEMSLDGPCELVAGELRMMTPAGGEHCYLVTRFAVRITNHVEGRGLGWVLSGEPGFLIARNPDTVRAPDVAFITSTIPPRAPCLTTEAFRAL